MAHHQPAAHNKNAPVDHPVHSLIQKRWSPVLFSSQPVEQEKLESIFEAARWAPSSYNEQPWRFCLGIRGEGKSWERIFSLLVEANQEWCREVPVLGVSIASLNFARNGKPNRHAYHDVGAAMGFAALQAYSLEGLALHQMAGFKVEEARTLLELPEGFDPLSAFAIGYVAQPLPEDPPGLIQRDEGKRERRALADSLYLSTFGHPWI